jgi:peptidoglycan lytic transglycosylase
MDDYLGPSRSSHAGRHVFGPRSAAWYPTIVAVDRSDSQTSQRWKLGLFCALATSAAFGVDEATLEARAELAATLARIETGATLDPAADSANLRQYVLYPYLESARLMRRLGPDADADVRGFLTAHAGEPVAFPLHRAWLASLADRGAWRELIESYSQNVASTETECRYLRARVELGMTEGLEALIAARWLTPARLPPSCEPAFQWLRDIGALGAAQTEARVRALLRAGQYEFAAVIARRLPEPERTRYTRWVEMLSEPIVALDGLLNEENARARIDDEMLLDVWNTATRDHPAEAEARFESLRHVLELDAEATSRFALALALGLAWDRQSSTLREFARVTERDLDDYALGWLTRAALWAQEWSIALRSIEMMSPQERATSRWRFWRARSLEALDERQDARALHRSILPDDNFYAAMAAARLGTRLEPNVMTVEREPAVLSELESWPAIVRARELFSLGMRVDATREWRFAMQSLTADNKEQAFILAHDWGWHDVAVATATEAGVFNYYELLYPLPFGSEIASAAKATRITDAVLYGLIRQESLFREDSISPAGAVGLTQLLPSTAAWTARHWEDGPLDTSSLLLPETNIKLGAATLRMLRDRYDGQLVVALAAYNAGAGAADRWLPREPEPTDIWIENIPYNETRDYVQRVIWHSLVYAWRQTGRPQSAAAWLGAVVQPDG